MYENSSPVVSFGLLANAKAAPAHGDAAGTDSGPRPARRCGRPGYRTALLTFKRKERALQLQGAFCFMRKMVPEARVELARRETAVFETAASAIPPLGRNHEL